jgi:hypothetical protein
MGLYVWVNDPENLSSFIHDAFFQITQMELEPHRTHRQV